MIERGRIEREVGLGVGIIIEVDVEGGWSDDGEDGGFVFLKDIDGVIDEPFAEAFAFIGADECVHGDERDYYGREKAEECVEGECGGHLCGAVVAHLSRAVEREFDGVAHGSLPPGELVGRSFA